MPEKVNYKEAILGLAKEFDGVLGLMPALIAGKSPALVEAIGTEFYHIKDLWPEARRVYNEYWEQIEALKTRINVLGENIKPLRSEAHELENGMKKSISVVVLQILYSADQIVFLVKNSLETSATEKEDVRRAVTDIAKYAKEHLGVELKKK